ncbi:MAG: hypothetical protein ACTSRP_10035 [Candidatus Helarchaeota archaeon]
MGMKFKINKEVENYIKEQVKDLIELEENKSLNDIGIIFYLRKASCGPMMKGGWKELVCIIDFYENYAKKYELKQINGVKIAGINVYMETNAIELLKDRDVIELFVEGAIIRDLKIKDAPLVDIGTCTFDDKT